MPATSPSDRRGRTAGTALVAAGVALGSLLLALPSALAEISLSPDAIEYVSIARAWLEGRGFVNPISFSYYFDDPWPPLPGTVARAPGLPSLSALPFGLGAPVEIVAVLHAGLGAAIAAGGVVLARRMMPLPAAAAFGVGFAWGLPWVLYSRLLLSEVSAVGMLFLLAAVAHRATRTVGGGVAVGCLVVLAWLTRPTIALFAPALLLAAAAESGPRRALRSAPLWAFTVTALGLQQAIQLVARSATGRTVYEHYAIVWEMLTFSDPARYQREYHGALAFIGAHTDAVVATLLHNLTRLWEAFFLLPDYHYVGWLAPLALFHGLTSRAPGSLARRALSFFALGSLALCFTVYAPFDWRRYSLPIGASLWLVSASLLGAAASWAMRRVPATGAGLERALHLAPALAVLAVFATASGPGMTRWVVREWQTVRSRGPFAKRPDAAPAGLCPHIPRDAIVVSADPWGVHAWCGNATLVAPVDLTTPRWVDAYLDELEPGWLVTDEAPLYRHLKASPRLERVASSGRLTLYRSRDPGAGSRRWPALPPLLSQRD